MSQPDIQETAAFYVGAAVIFDMDSDEVDAFLARRNLSLEKNGIAKCRAALRNGFPLTHEANRGLLKRRAGW